MSKKRIAGLGGLATLGVVVVLVGAACGGSGGSSGGMGPDMNMSTAASGDMSTASSGQQPDVVLDIAVRDVRYEPASIEVPAGKVVQIKMRNMDGVEHDMQVDGLMVEMMDGGQMAGDLEGMPAGTLAMHTMANGNASIMFRTEQKGTYQFYCTLPGHKDAGMVGELKVT